MSNIDNNAEDYVHQWEKRPLRRLARCVKALMDFCGGLFALIIFSPVMIWAAYKVHKEDNGPIFFCQERIGYHAKPFITYKFRTMFLDAEARAKILFRDDKIKSEYEEGAKLKYDPRLTKIGAFLRRTSIDELPQLFNVLKGDMSLIGPRPLTESDVALCYGKSARLVYKTKPGMTGLWQVSGRSDTDINFRRKINLYYVRHWSLCLDFWIAFRTVKTVSKGEGAY